MQTAFATIARSTPLVQARFLERPNRFVIRASLAEGGKTVTAHLADPGRLRELLLSGKRLWLRKADNPARKTRWSAVLVETPDGAGLISLDTMLPNRLIARALEIGALTEFAGWPERRREVSMGRSRIDFELGRPDGQRLALEVKSVTLVENGIALFPDAVTARGCRHLQELAAIAADPHREAAVLFVVQRSDAQVVRPARDRDPAFAEALDRAHAAGVQLLARQCLVTTESMTLGKALPVELQ